MQIVPCFWEVGPFCAGWLVEKLAFPVAIAYFVYRLALYQIEKNRLANLGQLERKRQIDFADKQLTEFYAPMVGARAEIFNRRVFDTYVHRATTFVEAEWKKRYDDGRTAIELHELKLEPAYSAMDKALRNERMKGYVAMRDLFAKKMAFADPDVRDWFGYFYAFVEMLRVDQDNDEKKYLSTEVSIALVGMFEEEPFQAFYAYLLERTDQLQREIQGAPSEVVRKVPKPPEVLEPWLFFRQSR